MDNILQDITGLIQEYSLHLRDRIEHAREVEFLYDLPFPVASFGETAVINMLIADAGAGKSLLVRSIIQNVLNDERYKNDLIVYIDLEFQEQIAKQRKFHELFIFDNFVYVENGFIEKLKERYKTKVVSTTIKNFLAELTSLNKRVIVFVDSFEDFIEDSSSDVELKRVFYSLLSLKSLTLIFSHHISKNELQTKGMRFRGSMIIKAKLSSLVFLKEKIEQNDYDVVFNLEVLKMRAYYESNRNISIVVDTNTFEMKAVEIVADKEEIAILKSIYFTLREREMLKKTELRDIVREKTKKSKHKVESVINKHADLFNVSIQDKNTHYYSLTNNISILDNYLALMGLGDSSLSDAKIELLNELEKFSDDEDVNIEVNRGDKVIVYKKILTIKSNIYKMTDDEAEIVLKKLRELNTSVENTTYDDSVDF